MKLSLKMGGHLPLMESFNTIQGEGYFSGSPAYFLRIGGCDVGCHWCDVKESWDFQLHPPTSVNKIIERISNYSIDTVVITGGEPLMWNMELLTKALKKKKLKVHLETSGSHPLSGEYDWICLSPKKNNSPLDNIKKYTNELKVIVHNKNDLIWAEQQRDGLDKKCKLFLQPEWSKREKMIPIIVDYIQENKDWSISLQTHKYMKIP